MRQGDIKNVIKRGGRRACFHAAMLTNTVIKMTFGDLRAQQISAIIFQCYITQSQTEVVVYLVLLRNHVCVILILRDKEVPLGRGLGSG